MFVGLFVRCYLYSFSLYLCIIFMCLFCNNTLLGVSAALLSAC
jgi:hypothetical protein